MSDDEVPYIKKLKSIHYGSLEESERARLEQKDDVKSDDEDSTTVPQVHVSNGKVYRFFFFLKYH